MEGVRVSSDFNLNKHLIFRFRLFVGILISNSNTALLHIYYVLAIPLKGSMITCYLSILSLSPPRTLSLSSFSHNCSLFFGGGRVRWTRGKSMSFNPFFL